MLKNAIAHMFYGDDITSGSLNALVDNSKTSTYDVM